MVVFVFLLDFEITIQAARRILAEDQVIVFKAKLAAMNGKKDGTPIPKTDTRTTFSSTLFVTPRAVWEYYRYDRPLVGTRLLCLNQVYSKKVLH